MGVSLMMAIVTFIIEDAQKDHEEDDGEDVPVGHGCEDVGRHYACELVDHVYVLSGYVLHIAGEHHVPAYAGSDDRDQNQAYDDGCQGGQEVIGESLAQYPAQVASRHAGHPYEDGRGYEGNDYHVQGVEEQVSYPLYVLCPVRQEYAIGGT